MDSISVHLIIAFIHRYVTALPARFVYIRTLPETFVYYSTYIEIIKQCSE
jgi:hypothetical protein